MRHTISHRTLQDLKEEAAPGKEAPFLARNFLQSGLGFLSQYNQKSLSMSNVYTETVERKRGREQKDKKNRTALFLHHSDDGVFSYMTLMKENEYVNFYPTT